MNPLLHYKDVSFEDQVIDIRSNAIDVLRLGGENSFLEFGFLCRKVDFPK